MKSHSFKIVIVGNSKVGKTALFSRYFDDTFPESWVDTMGADLRVINTTLEGEAAKIVIFDVAGMDRFRAMDKTWYRSTDVALITFDRTDIKTLENCTGWMERINYYAKVDKFILVGTKCELPEERKISQQIKFFALL